MYLDLVQNLLIQKYHLLLVSVVDVMAYQQVFNYFDKEAGSNDDLTDVYFNVGYHNDNPC